jgi:hypothetical protein
MKTPKKEALDRAIQFFILHYPEYSKNIVILPPAIPSP